MAMRPFAKLHSTLAVIFTFCALMLLVTGSASRLKTPVDRYYLKGSVLGDPA